VLYALKPSEVPAFRQRKREEAPGGGSPVEVGTGEASARPGPGAAALRREAEVLLRRLAELNRHRRGIDGSIRRVEHELEELLSRAGAGGVQTSLGLLRRLEASGEDGATPTRRFVIEV
jgi:hypothetical protein